MNTDYNDLIFKFTEHLKILNRSPDTIYSYTKNITAFVEAIRKDDAANKEDIKGITRERIETYILSLYNLKSNRYKTKSKNSSYSIATISIKIRSIKRFFEYLENTNIIFINPAEYIKEPKKEKQLSKDILTTSEINKLLEAPNLGTMMGIRDRAILETFYSTGIRLSELCHLTIFDVDLQGGLLRVNKGKGSKDRVVPIGKHAIRFIKEYIHKIRPYFTRTRKSRKGAHRSLKREQTRILFLNQHGEPIITGTIQQILRKYRIESKIQKNISAHTFRHTFATQLVRNGADIRAIQKMLGHSYLSTTQEYIKLAGTNLKKDHKKHHPREQEKVSKEVIKPAKERKKY